MPYKFPRRRFSIPTHKKKCIKIQVCSWFAVFLIEQTHLLWTSRNVQTVVPWWGERQPLWRGVWGQHLSSPQWNPGVFASLSQSSAMTTPRSACWWCLAVPLWQIKILKKGQWWQQERQDSILRHLSLPRNYKHFFFCFFLETGYLFITCQEEVHKYTFGTGEEKPDPCPRGSWWPQAQTI